LKNAYTKLINKVELPSFVDIEESERICEGKTKTPKKDEYTTYNQPKRRDKQPLRGMDAVPNHVSSAGV
jgi:hypothetical protein